MRDPGVPCPETEDGEHVLMHTADPFRWRCRKCPAVLRLGWWYEDEPAQRDGEVTP